jgi:hypothetical protein
VQLFLSLPYFDHQPNEDAFLDFALAQFDPQQVSQSVLGQALLYCILINLGSLSPNLYRQLESLEWIIPLCSSFVQQSGLAISASSSPTSSTTIATAIATGNLSLWLCPCFIVDLLTHILQITELSLYDLKELEHLGLLNQLCESIEKTRDVWEDFNYAQIDLLVNMPLLILAFRLWNH